MQNFAARFVDISLNLIGVPHYMEGTVIELTNGRFEIAEACAGLRFLIATVTLGILFSYLMYTRIYKAVLFLIASVAIPLIGNGLRCVGIILLAHYTNNEYGAGADHIVYGWGFNVAILLVLIFLGSLFRDESQKLPSTPSQTKKSDTTGSIVLVAILTALLASAGPAWAMLREHAALTFDRNVIMAALRSTDWREDNPSDGWRPFFSEADAHFLEGRDFGKPVDLFIGYYARPRAGRTVTAHFNKPWNEDGWTASDGGNVQARSGDTIVKLNEIIVTTGPSKRLVWFTYWANGALTNNSLAVRLAQAEAALTGHEGQAVIVLSTPLDIPVDEARAHLSTALGSLEPVFSSLRKAADGPGPGRRPS
jgi:EpsI family protein